MSTFDSFLKEQNLSLDRFLTEAIRAKDSARVQKLIASYLSKHTKYKEFIPMPAEEFTNTFGHFIGVRFIYDGISKVIRFNWKPGGMDSTSLNSVDIWEKPQPYPTHHISFGDDSVSLVKTLPWYAEVINSKLDTGDFAFIPEEASLKESISLVEVPSYLSEARGRSAKYTPEQLWHIAIKYLVVNEKPDSNALFKESQESYKILGGLKKNRPQYWNKLTFIGDKFKLEQEYGKILKEMGMITGTIVAGPTVETKIVELPPEIKEIESKGGVRKIAYEKQIEDLKMACSILIRGTKHLLMVLGRGGVGKSVNIRAGLSPLGISDNNGMIVVKATATPIAVYKLMYENPTDIIWFDDADKIYKTDDGTNILKAATETEKNRKISWLSGRPPKTNDPETGEQIDIPQSFIFRGKVIIASNKPLDKIDPDGALRTRGTVFHVNPSDAELVAVLPGIIDTFELPEGFTLTLVQKLEVVDFMATLIGDDAVNFRLVAEALQNYCLVWLDKGKDWKLYTRDYAIQ